MLRPLLTAGLTVSKPIAATDMNAPNNSKHQRRQANKLLSQLIDTLGNIDGDTAAESAGRLNGAAETLRLWADNTLHTADEVNQFRREAGHIK